MSTLMAQASGTGMETDPIDGDHSGKMEAVELRFCTCHGLLAARWEFVAKAFVAWQVDPADVVQDCAQSHSKNRVFLAGSGKHSHIPRRHPFRSSMSGHRNWQGSRNNCSPSLPNIANLL